MKEYLYFARFTKEEIGYSIDFPNVDGAYTEGDTIEECLKMAEECLGLHIYGLIEDGDDIPESPKPENIEVNRDQFIMPIKVYPEIIKYRIDNSSVKKTLTIPFWMNKLCEDKKLNFSKLLQDAILREVGYNKIK